MESIIRSKIMKLEQYFFYCVQNLLLLQYFGMHFAIL